MYTFSYLFSFNGYWYDCGALAKRTGNYPAAQCRERLFGGIVILGKETNHGISINPATLSYRLNICISDTVGKCRYRAVKFPKSQ